MQTSNERFIPAYPIPVEINAVQDGEYHDLEVCIGWLNKHGHYPVRFLAVYDEEDDEKKLRVMVWEDFAEDDPQYWFEINFTTGSRSRILEMPHTSGSPDVDVLDDRSRLSFAWTKPAPGATKNAAEQPDAQEVFVLAWDYFMPSGQENIVGVYETPELAQAEIPRLTRDLLLEEDEDVQSALADLPDEDLIHKFWHGETDADGKVTRWPVATYRITKTRYRNAGSYGL